MFSRDDDGGVYKVDLPHRFIADGHHEVVSFNPEQVPEVSESHGRTSSRKSIFLKICSYFKNVNKLVISTIAIFFKFQTH